MGQPKIISKSGKIVTIRLLLRPVLAVGLTHAAFAFNQHSQIGLERQYWETSASNLDKLKCLSSMSKRGEKYVTLWQTEGNIAAPDAFDRAYDRLCNSGPVLGICSDWLSAALGGSEPAYR